MNLLEWKSQYSVGIDSVDDEHRNMIELINNIYVKLESGADSGQIDQCLGEVFNTISMHFALEERMMRSSNYSEYNAHKEDHEDLLDQIRDLMDDFHKDSVAGKERLEKSLSDWFAGHFSSFDARLHSQLKH